MFFYIALLLDVNSVVNGHINQLFGHIETISCNTNMFHLKLLIILSLSIAGSNWLARLRSQNRLIVCLKPSGSPALLHQADSSGLLCVRRITTFLRRHRFWHTRWDHNHLIRSQRPMLAFIRPSSRRCKLFHNHKINKGHARRVTHTMDYLTGLVTEVQRLRRRSCLKGSLYMSTANWLNKADDGGAEASTDENLHDTDMHLDEKLLH